MSDCNKDIEYVMDEEWDLTFKFAPDSPSSVTADTIGKFICEVAKWCDQCAKEPLSWDAVRVNARRLSGLARQFKEDTYREMLQSSNSDIILAWIESNQATEPRCPFHVIYSKEPSTQVAKPYSHGYVVENTEKHHSTFETEAEVETRETNNPKLPQFELNSTCLTSIPASPLRTYLSEYNIIQAMPY